MPREWRSRKHCSAKCILNYCNGYMILGACLIVFQVIKHYNFLPAAYISLMCVLAAIIFVCSVLGFVGTFSENLCVTKAYAIIMLVGIIVQVITVCIAHKFADSIRESARNKVEKQWHEELVHPGAMDNLQIEFKCCGNDSSNDYINILQRAEIPSSCYSHSNATDTTLNTEGCFTGAEESIYNSYDYASRVERLGVVINIIIFAVVVYFVIKLTNKKRRDDYQT